VRDEELATASVLNAIAAHRGLTSDDPEITRLTAAVEELGRVLQALDEFGCRAGDDPAGYIAALRVHGQGDGR
jgi:hypothetical protein